MSKKTSAIVLTSLMVMNQVSDVSVIYASTPTQTVNNQEQSEKQTQQIIYLTDGEGSKTAGDGTKDNPYQNIRTALEQVEDGGVIKLIGRVVYTKYEEHPTNKSALPLTITKNITFEGEDPYVDGLYTRAPIQLGANVTFKNMRLEMVNLNQLMPGVQEPASTPADEGIFKSGRTIYTAGYTLTIDNVNTRIGSHIDQINDRPFISGGTYQDRGTIGPKSVVNIINANDETRFSSIYAGDYWLPRTHSFELNLDETTTNKTIVDHTIHTGNVLHNYQGDVTVNLAGATNVLTLDNTKHLGNVDVNITSSILLDNIILNKVRNLTLSEEAYMKIPSKTTFEVENLSIEGNAILDFTSLNENPKVKGTFTGSNDPSNTGAIYLERYQTLEVSGLASGFVRLNNHDSILTPQSLRQNHPYLKASPNSTAQLIINPSNGQESLGFKVIQSINDQNQMTWIIQGDTSQVFKDFYWNGGENQLIDPIEFETYIYPITYINEFDEVYTPDDLTEFKVTLTKHTKGNLVLGENDHDEDFTFWIENDGSICLSQPLKDPNHTVDPIPYEGDFTLTVTHIPTGKEITKTITLLRSNQNGSIANLTGSVTLDNNLKVGEILSATPENLPTDAKDLKYQWFVDGKEIPGATQSTFELKEEYIGKQLKLKFVLLTMLELSQALKLSS